MANIKLTYQRNEELFPHSPDVLERDTSDNGYSKGWGMSFPPVAKYWLDCHTHSYFNRSAGEESAARYQKIMDANNIKGSVIILPMFNDTDGAKFHTNCLNSIKEYKEYYKDQEKFHLMLYIDYKHPDARLVEEAAELGICGIKLHNHRLIMEAGAHDVWLSEQWQQVFKTIEKCKLPILWHVTQRLTDCPYTGGGRNSYWSKGWEKGVKYTNEDLLQVFLKVVGKYPGIDFLSAHQLHLGWDRLTSLFETYSNLYTDTTIGCYLKKEDTLYEPDRAYINDVFKAYAGRILFGTDLELNDEKEEEFIERTCQNHMRFIKHLKLPHDVLQKITHENAEKLFGLDARK